MRTCFAAVMLTTLLLAACGAADEDEALTRAQAVKQVNAICRDAAATVSSFVATTPAPSNANETRASLQQDVDAADAAVKRLDALNVPEEQRAEFERFRAGAREFAEANRTFVTAIDNKDAAGVRAGSAAAVAAGKKAEQAAKAYGLDDCPPPTTAAAFAEKGGAPSAVDPVGRWTGTVTQVNADGKRYRYEAFMTVKAVDDPGAVSGTVSYPSFPCSGDIVYTRTDGDRFYFRERITERPDKCPSGGRIRATVRQDEMAWRWTRGTITVQGILNRR